MSVKKSHISSSSGSVTGLGGSIPGVTRVSRVRSSSSYRSPSVRSGHGGNVISTSSGYGGLGNACIGGTGLGLGLGGGSAAGFTSSVSYGGGHSGGFGSGFGGGCGSFLGDGVGSFNEKETMQILNDRLATYLDRVRSLEHDNTQLESHIREWYDKQVPYSSPDFQNHFRNTEDYQNKILQARLGNANLILQIDNAKLAADDFRNKYENEATLCMGVQSDINGLRRVLEEINLGRNDYEMQLQSLTDEMSYLKKNHAEEVLSLRSQLGARVNVEVNAAPAIDLNRVLSEMREQYETMMEKNRKEAEVWFNTKSEELNHEVTSSAQQLQTVHTEIIELRHTTQNLEIDLQTQNSMKVALENTLAEVEARYGCQLSQLQDLINNEEAQLADLRSDLERQNYEYKVLMDHKSRLEMEIGQYRRLMDGEDIQRGSWNVRDSRDLSSGTTGGSSYSSTSGSLSYSGGHKPRTVVEDVSDGYSSTKRE